MKTILFCGGGSAGHVTPNIALIEELPYKYKTVYAGTNGIEKDICARNNVKFYEFDAVKLERGKIFKNLLIPFKLIKSLKQCKIIISQVKPSAIFCKGGYVSLPLALCAHKAKIPLFTHESDVKAGLANKIISKYCKRVFCTFETTAKTFKNGLYVGTPMRKNLFNKNKVQAMKTLGIDMRPTLLVFGGSHGSETINYNLRQIISELTKSFNVIHLCGKGNTVLSNLYGYKQIEFVDDMGTIYACADAAISRCGSNSANELIALKIPTLFIPLKNKASRGDQVYNAEYFKSKNLCRVLREKDLNPKTLLDEIYKLTADKDLKNNLSIYSTRSATKRIIEEIENFI